MLICHNPFSFHNSFFKRFYNEFLKPFIWIKLFLLFRCPKHFFCCIKYFAKQNLCICVKRERIYGRSIFKDTLYILALYCYVFCMFAQDDIKHSSQTKTFLQLRFDWNHGTFEINQDCFILIKVIRKIEQKSMT